MSATGGLTISGRTLKSFGAGVVPHAGHERSPDLSEQVLDAADGRIGGILVSDAVALSDLSRRIVADITHPSAAALKQQIDALKALLLGGELELVFEDRPDRRFTGRCSAFELEYVGPAQIATSASLSLPFVLSPLSERLTPTRLGILTGVRTPLPMGTAPSELTITVHGGGASMEDWHIILRAASGAIVFDMPFDGALTSAERVVVQSQGSRIRKINGTTLVAADAFALWDRSIEAATNDFPALRPVDADYVTATWATLELTAGLSGTPVGDVEYVERYL